MFLLLAIILFLPAVAAETKIFSGKVITDTDKEIDGAIFRFKYDEYGNKAFAQTPTTNLIIGNGECKSNNVFRVCINRANFSYKNITTYLYYYELDVTIHKLTGSLLTASKSVPITLLQNEPSKFEIAITNPTDFDVINIKYQEDLTPFLLYDVKGCSLNGNVIEWQGSLKSKYDKTCTATIIAEKEGTYTLVGNLSYFNGYETEKKATDSLAVKVLPKQLKVSYAVDKDVEVRWPFYINTSLKNIHSTERIGASINIEIPNNFIILEDVQVLNREFNTLRRTLILEPLTTFNYSLHLEASSEGNQPIKQKFDYTVKNIRDVIENNTFINPVEPKPRINFTAEYNDIVPGQKFIVIAKLSNPSKIHQLTNIKARLDATYNDQIKQNLNKLMPNESYTIISNTLIAPKDIDVDGNKIKLNLSIEYNFYGITKSVNELLEVKIKQDAKNITTENNIINQEIKIEEKVIEAQLENKTAQQVTKINEEPQPNFIQNIKLTLIVFSVIIMLTIPIIIYKIKKKKSAQSQNKNLEEDDNMK